MNNLKKILQTNNLKATHQRLSILNTLEQQGHIDIDNLYNTIIKQNPTISKATLYRNINELIEKDIIVEVKIPHQKNRYEIKKDPHIHLVCKFCGDVLDNTVDLSMIINNIQHNTQFQIQSSFVIFEGICPSCKG